MSQEQIEAFHFSPDILDFIVQLHRHEVRCLVIGGEAVIHYGHARLTGDIDFYYDLAPDNAAALFTALGAFWDGSIPDVEAVDDLREEGAILQFGRPPNRIDLLNKIDGISFPEAWRTRTTVTVDTVGGAALLHFLSLELLIRNKEAAGRPKDLEDLAYLRK